MFKSLWGAIFGIKTYCPRITRHKWRRLLYLLFSLMTATSFIWLLILIREDPSYLTNSIDDSRKPSPGLLGQMSMKYSAVELERVLSNLPGTVFVVDPEFLACVVDMPDDSEDLCFGILLEKAVLSVGFLHLEDSFSEVQKIMRKIEATFCVARADIICNSPSNEPAACRWKPQNSQPSLSHLLLQKRKSTQPAQLIHVIFFHQAPGNMWATDTLNPSLLTKSIVQCLKDPTPEANRTAELSPSLFSPIVLTDHMFEPINWRTAQSRLLRIPLLVPEKPAQLLRNFQDGRYEPCNETSAAAFRALHRNASQPSMDAQVFRSRVRKILAKTNKILEGLGVPWWISSGTCLGWFRECDSIAYSQDVDIGVWVKDYRADLITEFEQRGFLLAYKLGTLNDSLQLSFALEDTKLDIYFFYKEADHVWNGATAYKAGQKFKYIFPKFNLCWTTFLQIMVRVPCNTGQYITANYGEKWEEPVEEWDWRSSPPNSRLNGFWSEQERPEAIYLNPLIYPVVDLNGTDAAANVSVVLDGE